MDIFTMTLYCFQDLATDLVYTGELHDYNLLLKWATDKCVPLVREITFENAEVSMVGYLTVINVL